MSVAGLKKQLYKATQMVNEKVGGAEGTKLNEDFVDLEKKADVTSKALMEIINKTSEYLQLNTATGAKLTMLTTVSKIRGQVKSPGLSHPEGALGDSMTKYGSDMGPDSAFGGALTDFGESMTMLAKVKYSLDTDVKQNVIDPLQTFADKDIKDIQHHLKKLESRRLDYDYKKKRQGRIPEEEIQQALEKFQESKDLAETSMHNLLETEVEQVSYLSSLVESLVQYHSQASDILKELSGQLAQRVHEAQSRPKRERTPKPRQSFDYGQVESSNGGYTPAAASPPYSAAQPCCTALYDFEPENDGELGFREGDVINLSSRIDENWLEGSIGGRSGFFPANYVQVTVPLP